MLVAVSVGETSVGTSVSVSAGGMGLDTGVSVFGSIVGEVEVCVVRSTVAVLEGGTDVPCPLHATRNSTNKSMNRFIG